MGEGAALIDIAFEPVSSNRSLRCGETEFSARRQRGRNDLGDSTTPVQRQNHARQLRQFGATAGGVIRKFELTGLFEPKSPQPVSSNRNLRCGETEFSGQRQRARKGFAGSRTPLQRQNFAKQPRPFGGYSARTGKSPLERECVVADTVVVEPVSASIFPANREKYREKCEASPASELIHAQVGAWNQALLAPLLSRNNRES